MKSARIVPIDEIIDACLPCCLSDDGYSVYLRNPSTSDAIPVVQCATWQEAMAEAKKLRRILCGVIGAVMQEYLR